MSLCLCEFTDRRRYHAFSGTSEGKKEASNSLAQIMNDWRLRIPRYRKEVQRLAVPRPDPRTSDGEEQTCHFAASDLTFGPKIEEFFMAFLQSAGGGAANREVGVGVFTPRQGTPPGCLSPAAWQQSAPRGSGRSRGVTGRSDSSF